MLEGYKGLLHLLKNSAPNNKQRIETLHYLAEEYPSVSLFQQALWKELKKNGVPISDVERERYIFSKRRLSADEFNQFINNSNSFKYTVESDLISVPKSLKTLKKQTKNMNKTAENQKNISLKERKMLLVKQKQQTLQRLSQIKKNKREIGSGMGEAMSVRERLLLQKKMQERKKLEQKQQLEEQKKKIEQSNQPSHPKDVSSNVAQKVGSKPPSNTKKEMEEPEIKKRQVLSDIKKEPTNVKKKSVEVQKKKTKLPEPEFQKKQTLPPNKGEESKRVKEVTPLADNDKKGVLDTFLKRVEQIENNKKTKGESSEVPEKEAKREGEKPVENPKEAKEGVQKIVKETIDVPGGEEISPLKEGVSKPEVVEEKPVEVQDISDGKPVKASIKKRDSVAKVEAEKKNSKPAFNADLKFRQEVLMELNIITESVEQLSSIIEKQKKSSEYQKEVKALEKEKKLLQTEIKTKNQEVKKLKKAVESVIKRSVDTVMKRLVKDVNILLKETENLNNNIVGQLIENIKETGIKLPKVSLKKSKETQSAIRERIEIQRKSISDFFSDVRQTDGVQDDTEKMVQESVAEKRELITETLAKLYLQQNLYEKAIEAYRVLSEKNPEKKETYSKEIEKIKKNYNHV